MEKKLILVNPAFSGLIHGIIGRVLKFSYPPVFSVLEAMTPADYKIKTYNQAFSVKYEVGLVGITSFTSNIYRAYKYADKFRKIGAKVIMGGSHVMFNVDEALKHCDSVLVGEAEGIWQEILADYENNSLKSVYTNSPKPDFWNYYHENFLKLNGGKILNSLQTSRGCKFQCKFCTIPKLYEGKIRQMPINKVIEQINTLGKFKSFTIQFNDNNIYADPAYARKLFKELIPLNIKWKGLASIDIANDDVALDLAKKSGCKLLHIGFETVNKDVVKANPGKLTFYTNYLQMIKKIKARGIKIRGTFIVGFDEDTLFSIAKLMIFIFRANLFLSLFSVLTPFPGTAMFDEYKKEGRITTYNWKKYDAFHVVIKPKGINRFVLMFLTPFLRFSYLLTTNIGRFLLFILLVALYFKFF